MLEPERLIGAPLRDASATWDDREVLLYHLGLGAAAQEVDARELRYVYEKDLQVLPSFASVACTAGLKGFRTVPGLDLTDVVVLHAEHEVEVAGPIPVAADVVHTGRIRDLIDRERGALALFDVETRERASGQLLFRNTAHFYLKGLGGFGNPAPPADERITMPVRRPDRVTTVPLLPQQVYVYRLSGDRNPLHVDPAVAAKAGFARPLLHGLCTYGMACKAAVDEILDGDVAAVRSYRARFTGTVFPDEKLTFALWREDGAVFVSAATTEGGKPALLGRLMLR